MPALTPQAQQPSTVTGTKLTDNFSNTHLRERSRYLAVDEVRRNVDIDTTLDHYASTAQSIGANVITSTNAFTQACRRALRGDNCE